jgi:CRISPR type IV-associated DEAD/DEAH-box helicase Csf4
VHQVSPYSNTTGYEFSLAKIGFDLKSVETHRPIESSWLTDSVKAYIPSKESVFNPKNTDYHHHVAKFLAEHAKGTKGGILVLNTSYDTISMIYDYLLELGVSNNRIIAQRQNESASELKAKYITLYREGVKPIWLATGAAWTGLDITDDSVSADKDYSVASLIITRLPFSQPKSEKKELINTIANECYFKLKQGVGRLVRRSGKGESFLYLLDSRIQEPTPLYRVSRKLMSKYKAKNISE